MSDPQQPRDLVVERERLARLLAAESARVGELTEQLNDAILYEREARDAMASATRASALIRCGVSMERVALTIAERDARTIAALESERDALAAKLAEVRAIAEWHETKAMKARQYPGVGSEDVMAKAAQVHDDASRRLLAILDRDGGE